MSYFQSADESTSLISAVSDMLIKIQVSCLSSSIQFLVILNNDSINNTVELNFLNEMPMLAKCKRVILKEVRHERDGEDDKTIFTKVCRVSMCWNCHGVLNVFELFRFLWVI